MKVSVQYAQEHLGELLHTAQAGEEVEIAGIDQSAYRLILVKSAPAQAVPGRVLGAGRGKLIVPTWEEWKAMDAEIEREMCVKLPCSRQVKSEVPARYSRCDLGNL